MPRRGDHSKEELKNLILDAAEALVAEHGAAGLSARAIAKQIGYAAGTIYLNFANLDEVILHVNARTLDRMYAAIEPAASGRAGPVTRLKRAARAYVEFARANPSLWRLCFEHRLPPGSDSPDWLDRRIEGLVSLIVEPAREATQSTGRALETTAQALFSGVHGICMLTLTNKLDVVGKQGTEQLTDALISNYIRGVTSAHSE